MRKLMLLLVLPLTGCDDWPQARSKSELREIIKAETAGQRAVSFENERRLFVRTEIAEKRLKDAEDKIESLEYELRQLELQIQTLP
jgi:hypothetical protein